MRRAQYVELKRRWSNMGSLVWTEGQAPFWQTVLLFTKLVWNPTCLMCLAYFYMIGILASVQNLYDRSLHMFVWLLLAFVCMIAPCIVVSTIRISRFQMQTGFDWSFPSIHQDIRIILVFRSAVVTVVDAIFNVQPCLLKFGGDCDGHQVHPFLLKCCGDCGRAAVTTFDICQPDLYEGLSPESASIWDFSLSLARWVHRGGW